MSKLYIFGIGGTGSRVLRALTMLLASGVECRADAVVPMIIDPDAAAADLTRTTALMKRYAALRSRLNFDNTTRNRFFGCEILETVENFRLPLRNTSDLRFAEYMNLTGMSRANQALANMLFSQQNLAADMAVGFKGNPNVGSVVLNQFDDSQQFQDFANVFTEQDKIFIVSSIFGGTGASGFPLLLKTLRQNKHLPNHALLNNAHIGAITVLPYFAVRTDDESQIDSATFVSKAKSALAYYERNISRNNDIDHLYYIADDLRTPYENCEGGINQQNNAHFVELAAALAILDFATTENPASAVHREYGIATDTDEIIFDNLGDRSKRLLRKPLTQFLLFAKYLNERLSTASLKQPWTRNRQFVQTFFDGDFVRSVRRFQDDYLGWLNEMTEQQRKFSPFHLHSDSDKVFNIVKGIQPKRVLSLDSNYALFDNRLNNQPTLDGADEQQFVELFHNATELLVKQKLNIE